MQLASTRIKCKFFSTRSNRGGFDRVAGRGDNHDQGPGNQFFYFIDPDSSVFVRGAIKY